MHEKTDPILETFLRGRESREADAVYGLINVYYQCVAYKCPESDDDVEDVPFSEELKLPVEDRVSGIKSALTRLFDAGYDVNGSDGCFNAMMLAVGNGDAPMARFLIEHGADVNRWPDMDETPEYRRQNYYLEGIDIHFMNECFAKVKDLEYMKALHQTAIVLAKFGHLGPYTGHCLVIDEDGNVSLNSPQVLY